MDKRLMLAGCALIIFLAGGLVLYQRNADSQKVEPFYTMAAMERAGTITGYSDSEEDLVRYMVCQIQRGDLDLALRGCAIDGLSEYFVLESYIEMTDEIRGIEDLPPSETESTAYIGISGARLTEYYAELLGSCMELFGPGHEVQLLLAEEYVPDNPDGMYYQFRRALCSALGCTSVSEMRIQLLIDGEAREMYWSLARYPGSWKILAFHELESEDQSGISIRSVEAAETGEPLEYETDDVLPLNYHLANQNREETPEELLESFIGYLQREDVWSALSYCWLYDDAESEVSADQETLMRQGELAKQLQLFYYQLFIRDRNSYEWYLRDPAARGGDLVSTLMSDQVVSLTLVGIQQTSEVADGRVQYQIIYTYSGRTYVMNFNLVDRNGWMIESMGWQEDTWLY